MKKRIVWLLASCLAVLALLLAACAPAVEKEAAPAVKEAAPAAKEAAPVVKEAAPVAKEAAPAAGANMVKVTLTKLDGTKMEKLVEKPKYGGVFVYGADREILGWDSVIGSGGSTRTNQNLVGVDYSKGPAGTGESTLNYSDWFGRTSITGMLAESWEISDTQTIIYHIRKGVKWALDPKSAASRLVNGREFNADDVVFNLKRIFFDTPTASAYQSAGAARPTEVYATDKYTVVVKGPPELLGLTFEFTSRATMVPPEVVKKYGDMGQWENVVGTGPFILTDYVPMSSATFTRNPDYWEKDPILGEDYSLPYVDTYKHLIIPDKSTRAAGFRTGKTATLGYNVSREDMLEIKRSSPEALFDVTGAPLLNRLLGFRLDRNLPWNDLRVRRALMLALNFEEMRDTYYGGDAEILLFPVQAIPEYKALGWYTPPEQLPKSADGFDNRKLYLNTSIGITPEQKITEAKKLLADAGYPNGFKFELTFGPTVDYPDAAAMFKAYWAKIGVEATLKPYDNAVYQSMRSKGAYPDTFWYTGGQQPFLLPNVRKGAPYNHSFVDDPKIDQYYKDISAAYFDDAKRNKLMKEVNLYIIEKVWYITPPVANSHHIWWPWLKRGGAPSSQGTSLGNETFHYLWIDQELKKAMGD